MKLNKLEKFSCLNGGTAVELMAKDGDPQAFPPVRVMTQRADCNFSFTGMKIAARRQILQEYTRLGNLNVFV